MMPNTEGAMGYAEVVVGLYIRRLWHMEESRRSNLKHLFSNSS